MNTKKRWIITIIAALALAAVVVIGVILNHSADRVLKASEGTEEATVEIIDGESVPEEQEEEQPSEETVDLELPAPEEEAVSEAEPEEVSVQEEEISEMPEESETPEAVQEQVQEPVQEQEQEHVILATTGGGDETVEDEQGQIHHLVTTGDDDSEESEEGTSEEEEESGETELTAKAEDGTRVIVRKLHGSFPAGAYVEVFVAPYESAQSAVEKALDDNTELVDLIAYDITIYDKDGEEIIPDNDVEVTIIGASLDEGQGTAVYHIEESGEAEKVTDIQDPAEISFGAMPN